MNRTDLIQLLTQLLMTHSPSGREEEMDAIVFPMVQEFADKAWQDDCGNIIALRRGDKDTPSLAIVTHKDELRMIVKRIEADGKVKLDRRKGRHNNAARGSDIIWQRRLLPITRGRHSPRQLHLLPH